MFVGLDVHKVHFQTAVVDDEGALPNEERMPNDVSGIQRLFADIAEGRIVIESCSSAWYYTYDLLSSLARDRQHA
jgi:transposase